MLKVRRADESDTDILAEMNAQLIQDEGHRNTMPFGRPRTSTYISDSFSLLNGIGGTDWVLRASKV
jgi:hypothetical protein